MSRYDESINFYKKVFTLALPIALQSLITIGVNMLDTMMVGKLGDNSLSATSLANSFISVFQIFCMGLGMGASVLVSRYWGIKNSTAGDDEKEKAGKALKQTVCLVLRLDIILATLFALATFLIPDLIMRTYTDKEPIITLGIDYFRMSVVTYYFVGLSLVATIVLRSVGQVFYPLVVSIGAFSINLAMNYTFIFGKFGAPKMGVAGAALGTFLGICKNQHSRTYKRRNSGAWNQCRRHGNRASWRDIYGSQCHNECHAAVKQCRNLRSKPGGCDNYGYYARRGQKGKDHEAGIQVLFPRTYPRLTFRFVYIPL